MAPERGDAQILATGQVVEQLVDLIALGDPPVCTEKLDSDVLVM
jgi:hypothetical protein